jgi:hypothetical protein
MHVFRARAQRRPRPVVLEPSGELLYRICVQSVGQMRAFGHHDRVDAEDALLPRLGEDPRVEVDGAKVLDASETVL